MSQAPKAPPPHALSHHWPARPLLQTHFRCRQRPPPQRARATTTAPVHEKRQSERPTQRPHVRRTRPYHTAVAHTATHTTTTRVTISFDRCATREDHAAVGRVPPVPSRPRVLLTHCYPTPSRSPPRATQRLSVAPSPRPYRPIVLAARTKQVATGGLFCATRRVSWARRSALSFPHHVGFGTAVWSEASCSCSTAGRGQCAVFRWLIPARGSCGSCGYAPASPVVVQVMRRWLRRR